MQCMKNDDAALWTRFWQSARTACCVDHGDVSYNDDFRAPWLSFFGELEISAKVLDLCTGNGAILLFALECDRSFELHGVDSADIDPTHFNPDLCEALSQIVFHANTSITSMPFPDASFDAVTSQYGIEYAPLDSAAAETVRVLKTGGRGRLIVHAREGITVDCAAREIADIDELINEIQIFDAATTAIELVYRAENIDGRSLTVPTSEAKQAYDDFNRTLAQLGETWKSRAAASVYQNAGAILQHTFLNRRNFPRQTLVDKVSETKDAVDLHRERLALLTESALTYDDCQSLAQSFFDLGCTAAETGAIHDKSGENLLGWSVTIHK